MRKLLGCLSVLGLAFTLTGCVAPMGVVGGVGGGVYTDVSGPVCVGSFSGASKVGQASSEAIVCVATGDSSIKAAAANGGITKIQHVDYHVMSVLGLYAKTTTTVYGE
jgi:hypothetical protein